MFCSRPHFQQSPPILQPRGGDAHQKQHPTWNGSDPILASAGDPEDDDDGMLLLLPPCWCDDDELLELDS